MSKPSVNLLPVSRAALIRAAQQDEHYKNELRTQTHLFLQKVLGPRNWIQWKQQIQMASDLSFYACTTLNGLQTLGEEYVRIVQVDGYELRAPSVQVAGPFLLDSLFKHMNRLVEDVNHTIWSDWFSSTDVRDKLTHWLPIMKETLSLTQRVHLVLFYFFGFQYDMSKSLCGINYAAVRSWMAGSSPTVAYKLLGVVTLAQMVISIIIKYWAGVKGSAQVVPILNEEEEDEPSTPYVDTNDPRLKCSLCLEPRKDSTSTPCGHLFCWTCIHHWLDNKRECPLCRAKVAPSRLIFLQN